MFMRHFMRFIGIIALLLIIGISSSYSTISQQALPLNTIRLPHGFKITQFATNIPSARMMALGTNGTLFIGTRGNTVYAIPNATTNTVAPQVLPLITGLDIPSGVAFRDGALYVGTNGQVLRYDNIEANLNNPPQAVVINDTIPASHGARTIRFGPDDKLYIKVGAPCNVCENTEPYASTIVRMNPNGSNIEIYVQGTRNAVGYDWHPLTGELWFTNNGRDGLGDEIPPETLNHATTIGQNFGFPYCHAGYISDPEFGHLGNCNQFTPPAQLLPAHVAPLGMRFYTGTSFPTDYVNQVFIAEHGSWNRSSKIGYRISLVRINPDGSLATGYEIFADGWLQADDAVWGRPVDVQTMPDGALLISDDYANAIYRVQYICSLAGFGGQTFTEQALQQHIQNNVSNRPTEWVTQNAFIDLVNCGVLAIITTEWGEIGMVKVSIADENGLLQMTIDAITGIDGISPTSMAYQTAVRDEFLAILMQSLQDLIGDAGDNGFSRVAITGQQIELLAQP
jgi:glucose/arabinose dehydrogenase